MMTMQQLTGVLPKPNSSKSHYKEGSGNKVIPESIYKGHKKSNKRCFQKAKPPKKLSTEKAGQKNSQKKTSLGSEKGKDLVMERNDSDDDSFDLDNMEGMREAMAEI